MQFALAQVATTDAIKAKKMMLPKAMITAAMLSALGPTAAHAAGPVQTVMTGLNNPYGLAFGPDGALYVAEAGTGNNGLGTGPNFNGGTGVVYFGDTGSVSKLLNGTQTRVITGLPSVGPGGGGESSGLQGITFDSTGTLYGVFGLGGTEAERTQLVTAAGTGTNAGYLGQVVRLSVPANSATPVSDLVPYETTNYATNNPDGTVPEANPYAIATLPAGGFAVSDGGGNVVFKIPTGGGTATLLAAIPAMNNTTGIGGPTYQSVPTALALNSTGGLFVGEFTGFPFPAGGASIFSVNASTGALTAFATGFTTISGMAFGSNGDLYVLDSTTNGLAGNPGDARLYDVDHTTGVHTLLADLGPGGDFTDLIFGPDNALYFSEQSPAAASGVVLRYSVVPEPALMPLLGAGLALGLLRRRKARGNALA